MNRLRALGAITVAVFLAVATASCTGQSPGRATAASPTGPLPVRDRTDLAWTDLGATIVPPFQAIGLASLTYEARSTADDRTVEIRRRSDHAVVARHVTGKAGYAPAFVDLAGDLAVVVDEDVEVTSNGVQGLAQAFRYDLRTGAATAISSIPSAAKLSVFGRQATVTDDGRYYYSADVDAPANPYNNCVARLDLLLQLGSIVECARGGDHESDGYYVAAGEDGATWLHVQGPAFESCRTGRGVRGSTLIPVGPADGCATLGTATVGGWSVWSATPAPAGTPDATVALRATDGTRPVELGEVNGAALTSCGGYAYWRIGAGTDHQVRRWRPGMSTVEIVYHRDQPPNGTAATYQVDLGGCADGVLTLAVFTVDAPAKVSTVRLLTLKS